MLARSRPSLALALGLVLLTATTADARILPASTEISLGRELASLIEQTQPVDRDPIAVARVQQIGRRLVGVLAGTRLPFEFHVVESPQINAFALPGGFVYIHRGLLDLLPSDDAVAFVLAHEISHATEHHGIEALERSLLMSTLIRLTTRGGIGTAAEVSDLLLQLRFSRDNEREADRLGLRLMTSAGFRPEAAVEAMAVIQRTAERSLGLPFLRTHPVPTSRLARLRELAAEERTRRPPAAASVAPPPLPDRWSEHPAAVEPKPSEYFPLASGAVWLYRVRDREATSLLRVRVLDALPGCARLELQLGRGGAVRWCVTTTGDRLLVQPSPGGEWRLLAALPPNRDDRFAVGATERVCVPAGEFDAVTVVERDESGQPLATSWYVREIGLVKRVHHRTGHTEELDFYRIPTATGAP